ncbi:MAG: hypothetical protein OXC07_00290, partial [Kistimonas sp.]|nr:hypothetical protein [Kistimonas sp.]
MFVGAGPVFSSGHAFIFLAYSLVPGGALYLASLPGVERAIAPTGQIILLTTEDALPLFCFFCSVAVVNYLAGWQPL